jgi:hypothetical protein
VTTLVLNGSRAKSVRLLVPWQGAWTADVDYDLPVAAGRATLVLGAATLVGTVDAGASGRFAAHVQSRVVGGANGWTKTLGPRAYHNDAGVKLSSVIETTAAEAKETIVSGLSTRLGVDYERAAGVASSVLDGLDWHADFAGKTIVGPRATVPAPASVQVLSWDPLMQKAEIASDDLVQPGMVLTDARLDGSVTVRDVEQTFGEGGARATAWCGAQPKTRLSEAFSRLIEAKSRIVFARAYRYRIVEQKADGRLALQAVEKSRGLPDMIPLTPWPGMAGLSATYAPGSEVIVEFIAGDPSRPIVRSFQDGAPPLVLRLDASTRIDLAGGADYVALAALVLSELNAIRTAFNTHVHSGGTISGSTGVPAVAMGGAGSVAASRVKAT